MERGSYQEPKVSKVDALSTPPASFGSEKVYPNPSEKMKQKLATLRKSGALLAMCVVEAGGTPSRHNSFRTFAEMKKATCIQSACSTPINLEGNRRYKTGIFTD